MLAEYMVAGVVVEGDVIGLTVTREREVEDAEGGILARVDLSCNGETIGASVSGLHLCASRQWFFAVSGESEAVNLVRLAL